jgi:two-component system, cell cycle sensor histidine kinase and response regulator CckA
MSAPISPLLDQVVLVVDDEEQVCLLAARILADAGFHVLEAHNGADALTLLSRHGERVRLVVSDITMPGMSGVELATTIATRWPAMPILLVSGQGGPPADYRGPSLAKPFTPDALVDAVTTMLPVEKH